MKYWLKLYLYQGRARTLKSLAEEAGQKVNSFRRRLMRGWTLEEAMRGRRGE